MANVTLQIGGRGYAVACEDGQEAHISRLGQTIDGKVASLGENVVKNEARMLLFAALLLADEGHELRIKAAAPAPAVTPPEAPSTAPALEALAARLENLAESLEA